MEVDRRAFIASLGGTAAVSLMDHEAKAEALEHWMEERLDEAVAQQGGPAEVPQRRRTRSADRDPQLSTRRRQPVRQPRGGMMKKLPPIPKNATLKDFFELRFMPANHVLQSATRALKTGMSEEVVLACLLHDVVLALIKVDHGWWGAQLFEPYIPEKSTFAIRYHQALRFYPDSTPATNIPINACASSATTTRRRRTSRPPTRWCATTSGTWSRGS